jgi:hypothetical protein
VLEVSQLLTSSYTTDPKNKTEWYWHKNILEDQWIRIEGPDRNPCTRSRLIFNKGAQKHTMEKRSSSTNVTGKTEYPHVEDLN